MADLEPLAPAELLNPEGPAVAAAEWIRCSLGRLDLAAGFALTEADMRWGLADHWLALHPYQVSAWDSRGSAVAALAAADQTHPAWTDFASAQLQAWWGDCLHLRDVDMGVSSYPEPVAPEFEVVQVAWGHDWESDDLVTNCCRLLMRRCDDGRWLVAGGGHNLGGGGPHR